MGLFGRGYRFNFILLHGAFMEIIFWALLYFLPSINAGIKHHHQGGAIFVVNLFLGWTFIGWVVALAMSCGNVKGIHEKETKKTV